MIEWKVAPSYANAEIVTVNEETHKALIEEKCDRCGGLGIIVARVENNQYIPIPVDGGICYKCNGAKKIRKWVKAYTPEELDKYLSSQEKAKARKIEKIKCEQQKKLDESEQNKKELLTKWGYDAENPQIWLIGGGNTYEIKDQLKEQGCKFCRELGWYNNHEYEIPEGYTLVSINFFDVYEWIPLTKRFEIKDDAKEKAEATLATLMPASHSEYVGEVKERLRDLEVTLTNIRFTDGYYGTSTIYTFKQGENILVWITSSCKEIDVGDKLLLTGTVKEQKEYRGVKQTYLSRCIVKVEK